MNGIAAKNVRDDAARRQPAVVSKMTPRLMR